MTEVNVIIDALTGVILVEAPSRVSSPVLGYLRDAIGPGQDVACAAPSAMRALAAASTKEVGGGSCVRVAGYYHNSLIEGPGRRSTVKLQGCAIRCHGCITPDSWDLAAGVLVSVDRVVEALLDPAYERNGVSIVGGEPFVQPDGLLALVQALRERGCRHILVYSGYTYEGLRRLAKRQPAMGAVLDEIDVLVDGPYVEALAENAGPWTGSGNQRVIDLVATRQAGRIVVLDARP